MSFKDDLKHINDDIKQIYLMLIELESLENGENVDYSGVVMEISWNKLMLENRLKTLKEKRAFQGV